MERAEQVQRLRNAIADYERARYSGDGKAINRAIAVWDRCQGNSSEEEISAAWDGWR